MSDIQQLKDMGFGVAEAEVALRETNGNVEQALELLLTGTLGSDSPEKVVSPKSEWPELPKKPPAPPSPSGYGKTDAKPPGLDQDEAALGLSLEDIALQSDKKWPMPFFVSLCHWIVSNSKCPSAGKRANTTNATTCRAALWPAQCWQHLLLSS